MQFKHLRGKGQIKEGYTKRNIPEEVVGQGDQEVTACHI